MWRRGRKRGSGAADEPSDAAAGGSVSLPYDASAGASPSATVSLNVLPEVLTMIDASAEGIRVEGAVELGRLVDHAQGEAATVICEYLLEAGALEILCNLLDDENPVVHKMALLTLGNLASDAFDPSEGGAARTRVRQALALAITDEEKAEIESK